MKKFLATLFWTVFGLFALGVGLAGNPVGWFLLLIAAWSAIATIRSQDDRNDKGEQENGGWFNIGGCGSGGGCGGCGGCGG